MALTHAVATRNAIANAACDPIDAGAGAGNLVYRTGADAEVATCPFSLTAFGAPANGVKTANPITNDSNATGGVAAICTLEDDATTEVMRGTVTSTGGGGDIELTSNNVQPGDTVQTNSLVYTAPP